MAGARKAPAIWFPPTVDPLPAAGRPPPRAELGRPPWRPPLWSPHRVETCQGCGYPYSGWPCLRHGFWGTVLAEKTSSHKTCSVFISKRTLGELEDRLKQLEASRADHRLEDRILEAEKTLADLRVDFSKVDLVALEQLHRQVLNTIRSLRRLAASQNLEEEGGGTPTPDPSQVELLQPSWARRKA